MAIKNFFTKDIVIRRQRSIGGSKINYVATATVDGWFENLDKEAMSKLGIVEEKAWYFWFLRDEDVQQGDILIDENGNEYYVQEAVKRDIGVNQHLEVIAIDHNA